VISVEKLPVDAGGRVEFDAVLLVTRDGGEIVTGADGLKSARVSGEVVRHSRSRKVSVVKFKRRKNYRRNRGHRQAATTVRITNIEV
jgi:large subunit ribosomal protein L21